MRLHKPSPAALIACLALFLVLGGTAAAFKKFIITNIDQIKPNVVHELRGQTGKTGKTGPQGEPGPEGKAGTSGTTVVARARSTGSVASTTTEGLGASVPLTGATWTQGAQELDQLVGEVEVTVPTPATCTGNAVMHLLLDGTLVGTAATRTPLPGETTQMVTIQWSKARAAVGGNHLLDIFQAKSSVFSVLEPGAETARTLTAAAADSCGVGGGNNGGHFTVTSIKVDVLGAR